MSEGQGKHSDLPARLASGLAAVAFILLPLGWGNAWGVLALAFAAMVWGLHEHVTMALREQRSWAFPLALAVGTPVFLAAALGTQPVIPNTSLTLPAGAMPTALVLAVLGSAGVFLFTAKTTEGLAERWAWFLLAVLHVPLLIGLLAGLVGFDGGTGWLWVPLFVGWGGDVGAYFAGRSLGRHKMLPLISPKKTWEGFFGGVAFAVLCLAFYKVVFFDRLATSSVPLTWLDVVVVGVVGDLAGVIGDLVASMIKRTHGVKDSGRFLPGHGGMLDRIDAILFVGPVVYVWAAVLKPLWGSA